MRLVKMSVRNFQAIASADVEFGPGLNVLYGPNDLGKSSLAAAMRAALLLPHGSSAHTRFVPWLGGAEPSVELTIHDSDGCYWRVNKTFGGASGSSRLARSENGHSFTNVAQGRQVDEQLRALLRWGLHKPGGQGGPKGFPVSFLTQALLAEQDEVRKILFEASLGGDPDPEQSGRLRLTEALGALAQDARFKAILERAQHYVDEAFTPKTGKKRRGGSSPFAELADALTKMSNELRDVELKIRESQSAEEQIVLLNNRFAELEPRLATSRSELVACEERWAVRTRRDELQTKLDKERARIVAIEELERDVASSQRELAAREGEVELSKPQLEQAKASLRDEAAKRDARRRDLDTSTHESSDDLRSIADADEALKAIGVQRSEAQRRWERSTSELRQATTAAGAVAHETHLAAAAVQELQRGEATEAAARAAAAAALGTLGDAKERLRSATSEDRARTRALRRAELEKEQLELDAQEAAVAAKLKSAREVGQLVAETLATTLQESEHAEQLRAAQIAVTDADAAAARLDRRRAALATLEGFGALLAAEAALADHDRLSAEAASLRANAAALRREAKELAATTHPELPAASAISVLRSLREQCRVAEAQLSGGISVVVRPRRPLIVRATRDRAADQPVEICEDTSFTVERSLGLSIEEVLDIDITVGEASVRAAALALQARWEQQGAALLRSLGVDSVEELEALRIAADAVAVRIAAMLRQSEDLDRDAAEREVRAGDRAGLAARAGELGSVLGLVERAALTKQLAELGGDWSGAIRKQVAVLDEQRTAFRGDIDSKRELATRLIVQLEALAQQAAACRARAESAAAALGEEAWTTCVDRASSELSSLAAAREGLSARITELSQEDTASEQEARVAVADAKGRYDAAAQKVIAVERDIRRKRDDLIAATTRLDHARRVAREIDRGGGWATALDEGAADLDTRFWSDAAREAEQACAEIERALEIATSRHHALSQARTLAIQAARNAVEAAELAVGAAQATLEQLQAAELERSNERARLQTSIAEMRIHLAGQNVDAARVGAMALQAEIDALAGIAVVDEADVEHQRHKVAQLAAELRDVSKGLDMARGALQQVGGAVVRERKRELEEAVEHARKEEHDLEVRYDGWKLLVETLRECETSESAHLGRALAGPVSRRLGELTGGRYGQLALGPDLETEGLEASGEVRDIGALSSGTQDQLATLLRLCIAEQLGTALLLDDHLSQSDPERVAWFNGVLRSAAHRVQIILITCRPDEVIAVGEQPVAGNSTRSSTDGLVRAIDLDKIIHRFAAADARAS